MKNFYKLGLAGIMKKEILIISLTVVGLIIGISFAKAGNVVSVNGTITADNHYALYYGSNNGSSLTFVGQNESGFGGSPGNYNWSVAENWNFTMNEGDYIYIAAWSDNALWLRGSWVNLLPVYHRLF